jgi:EAL domain-containing protein (putative c-di-GMP-specific phosphodiesterase class I)
MVVGGLSCARYPLLSRTTVPAGGLGLTAVAEGVETAEPADELHRLGHRPARGCQFGKPVRRPDFRAGMRVLS